MRRPRPRPIRATIRATMVMYELCTAVGIRALEHTSPCRPARAHQCPSSSLNSTLGPPSPDRSIYPPRARVPARLLELLVLAARHPRATTTLACGLADTVVRSTREPAPLTWWRDLRRASPPLPHRGMPSLGVVLSALQVLLAVNCCCICLLTPPLRTPLSTQRRSI